MSVKYEGKSPNKFWYAWQHTKGLAKSFFNPATERNAKDGAKSGGISTAVLVGGGAISKIGFIAILPIVPSIISIAAVAGAGYFGLNAYRKFKLVKNSAAQSSYIRKQEDKWLERKTRAPLGQRIKNAIGRKLDAIPRPLLSLGKWGGIAAAVGGLAVSAAAGLSAMGVAAFSSSATATAVLGGIAKAGALIGLTATGATAAVAVAAVVAIPVGLGISALSRKIAYRTDPDRPRFGRKKGAEAEVAQTAAPKKALSSEGPAAAPDATTAFNDNTAPAQPEPEEEKPDPISEERKKAAAARAAARKAARKDGGHRFG